MNAFSSINVRTGKYIDILANVAALRNYDPRKLRNGDCVLVSSKNNIGDGDGNAYVWVEDSTATDDGTNTVRPNTVTSRGRWIKMFGTGPQGVQGLIGPIGLTGPRGPVGDPGGNVLAIGLFTGAAGVSVSAGTTLVQTSGYNRPGIGAAKYAYDASLSASYVTSHPTSAFAAADGRIFKLSEPVLYPEMFGAVGDGVFDDHDGFRALSKHVQAIKNASIAFASDANYLVGRQTPHPLGPTIAYLIGENPLEILNCENVSVDLGGANFKFKNGLKLGSFDPATGNKLNTTLPFYDYSKRADIGTMMFFQNIKNLYVSGSAHIDMNSLNCTVGGGWGDTGFQLTHYGLYYAEIDNLISVAAVYAHDSLLDLFCYRYYPLTDLDTPKLAYIRNLYGERCGRNVISIVGGNNIDLDSCVFRDPGQGYYEGGAKKISSSPASCCDVEAEGAVIRNVRFGPNLYCIGGPSANTAWVADSGDSKNIVMQGRMYGPVWTSKPKTTFRNATIKGYLAKVAGSASVTNAEDCTIIDNCDLYDTTDFGSGNATIGGGLFADGAGSGPGVVLRNSRIYLSRFQMRLDGWISRNNEFYISQTTASVNDMDYSVIMTGDMDGDKWFDMIPAAGAPANGYAILFNDPPKGNGELFQTPGSSAKLRWFSWSPGAGGFPYASNLNGKLIANRPRVASITLARSDGTAGGGYYGTRRILSLPAKPIEGLFSRDDLVLSESPTITDGQIVFGWLRLTDGSAHVENTDWFTLKFGDKPTPPPETPTE